MDSRELSNIAFLVRTVASNPTVRTLEAADSEMKFHTRSTAFQDIVHVLQKITNTVAKTSTSQNELVANLTLEAQKLVNHSSNDAEKAVGKLLLWALESNKNKA